jgi:hypothetical protein
MKSKDLQKVVLSKYKNGDSPPVIFRHLNGAIGLRKIGTWCKMIREIGSIDLGLVGCMFRRFNTIGYF